MSDALTAAAILFATIFLSLILGIVGNLVRSALEDVLEVLVRGALRRWPFLARLAGVPQKPQSYAERISELTSDLGKATAALDGILLEMSQVTKERERSIASLEMQVRQLEEREKELNTTIENLKNVPLPVAEHFAALANKGEKRTARRDYLLFAAGVIVSAIVSIILKVFGIG